MEKRIYDLKYRNFETTQLEEKTKIKKSEESLHDIKGGKLSR